MKKQQVRMKSKRYTPKDDAVIKSCMTAAKTKTEGIKRASELLNRDFRSIKARIYNSLMFKDKKNSTPVIEKYKISLQKEKNNRLVLPIKSTKIVGNKVIITF